MPSEDDNRFMRERWAENMYNFEEFYSKDSFDSQKEYYSDFSRISEESRIMQEDAQRLKELDRAKHRAAELEHMAIQYTFNQDTVNALNNGNVYTNGNVDADVDAANQQSRNIVQQMRELLDAAQMTNPWTTDAGDDGHEDVRMIDDGDDDDCYFDRIGHIDV